MLPCAHTTKGISARAMLPCAHTTKGVSVRAMLPCCHVAVCSHRWLRRLAMLLPISILLGALSLCTLPRSGWPGPPPALPSSMQVQRAGPVGACTAALHLMCRRLGGMLWMAHK